MTMAANAGGRRHVGGGVVRQYDVGAHEDRAAPPPRRPAGADLRGLGRRHWALVELLAEHGALHTGQVTALLFGSRPAAVRHLRALLRAGLVWRFVHDDDPTHMAFYEISFDGVAAVQDRMRGHSRPVPPALGRPGFDQAAVAEFFTGLAADARDSGGRRLLYRWRRSLDTAAWLRQAGVDRVRPRASGVWIEDGVVVRFLLHVDHDEPGMLSGDPAPPPAAALAGYRHTSHGVPALAVLVLCPTSDREQHLHRDLVDQPVPVVVAATTDERLSAAPSPAAAVWTLTGPTGDPVGPVRLVDLAR
jgi:hypothetical protein